MIAIATEHVLIRTMPNQTFFNVSLYNITASFDIALLMVIGGYFVYTSINKHSRIISWIWGKAKYLLIPHILFNIGVYWLSYTGLPVWGNLSKEYTFLQWLDGSLLMDKGEWFLWVLFISFVMLAGIHRLSKSMQTRNWLILSSALVIALVLLPVREMDFLGIYKIQFYFPFAFAGYLGARYKDVILRNFSIKHLAMFAIVALVAYIYVMPITEWKTIRAFTLTDFQATYLRYLQALTALPVIFFMGYLSSKTKLTAKPLAFAGRQAIWIYLCTLGFTRMGFGEGVVLTTTSAIGAVAFAVMFTTIIKRIVFNLRGRQEVKYVMTA